MAKNVQKREKLVKWSPLALERDWAAGTPAEHEAGTRSLRSKARNAAHLASCTSFRE
jgi:hypothetical protein